MTATWPRSSLQQSHLATFETPIKGWWHSTRASRRAWVKHYDFSVCSTKFVNLQPLCSCSMFDYVDNVARRPQKSEGRSSTNLIIVFMLWRRGWDSKPTYGLPTAGALRDRLLKPLGHPPNIDMVLAFRFQHTRRLKAFETFGVLRIRLSTRRFYRPAATLRQRQLKCGPGHSLLPANASGLRGLRCSLRLQDNHAGWFGCFQIIMGAGGLRQGI